MYLGIIVIIWKGKWQKMDVNMKEPKFLFFYYVYLKQIYNLPNYTICPF